MDPDLYASPGVFKFDRFKKDPETGRQPTFVKDGIKANTTILAFSEGTEALRSVLPLTHLYLIAVYT